MLPTENPYGPDPESLSNWTRIGQRFKKALRALLVVALVGTVALRFWPDDAIPDDSSMLPVWNPVPDDNPLARFQNWNLGRGGDLLTDDSRLGILKKDDAWDAQSADSLLQDWQGVIYIFKKLADEADQPWKWGEVNTSGVSVAAAADLALIKSKRLIETGEIQAALELAEDLLKCGGAIKRARRGLSDVSASGNLIENGAQVIEWAAKAVDLSEGQRREISDLLASSELNRDDLKFAFQANYVDLKDLVAGLKMRERESLESWFRLTPMLQENATLNLYLKIQKPVVASIDAPWSQFKLILETQRLEVSAIDPPPFLEWATPNRFGRAIASMGRMETFFAVTTQYRTNVRLRLSRLCLAIRAHELKHGRLPTTLNELSPAYLPSIPTDPYGESQPFQWIAEKRVLYSIGRDGIDDGGSIKVQGVKNWTDDGIEYWWPVKPQTVSPPVSKGG